MPLQAKKQIVIRPRVSGSLNEGMYIDLQAALETAHIPDAEKPFAEALNAYLMDNIANSKLVIGGEHIFKLYDTYGFPYDLTADMARELGIDLDEEGFNREMEAQRARARAAQNFKANAQLDYTGADTEFTGYEKRSQDTKIIALYKGSEAVDELQAGEAGVVVFGTNPVLRRKRWPSRRCGLYLRRRKPLPRRRHAENQSSGYTGNSAQSYQAVCKVGDAYPPKIDNDHPQQHHAQPQRYPT